jgi:predicted GNAT family acetyltransferase
MSDDAPRSDIEVSNNTEDSRFEARLDGALAGYSVYRDQPGRRVFVHTVVDPAFEGHGVGSALASGALDATRAAGLTVVPQCPFIRSFIEHHPAYQDLVADSGRR